jgi:hypothetical protein
MAFAEIVERPAMPFRRATARGSVAGGRASFFAPVPAGAGGVARLLHRLLCACRVTRGVEQHQPGVLPHCSRDHFPLRLGDELR